MTIKEEQVSQQFKTTLYSRICEVMWSLFLHGKNSFDNLNEVNKKRSQDNLYNQTIMPNSFPIIDICRKKNYRGMILAYHQEHKILHNNMYSQK